MLAHRLKAIMAVSQEPESCNVFQALTSVAIVSGWGKAHTEDLGGNQPLLKRVFQDRGDRCVDIRVESTSGEVQRADTNDAIDTLEVGVLECIADTLILDDNIRRNCHLVQV